LVAGYQGAGALFWALQEPINNVMDNIVATKYIIEIDFVFILFKIYVQVKVFTVFLTLAANESGLLQSGPGMNQAGEVGYLTFSANLRQPSN
jgi:hypothetical protein